MRSNALLKWLMLPLVMLLVFVGLRLSNKEPTRPAPNDEPARLTTEEMKSLGIEGDTPRDTVATLVAQVKQLRNELQTALTDNKHQRNENERLRQREQAVDQRIQTAWDSERARLQQERESVANDQQHTQGMLQELQRKLNSLGGDDPSVDLPVGLGLRPDEEMGSVGETLTWIEPNGSSAADSSLSFNGKGLSFPTRFGTAQTATEPLSRTEAEPSTKAVYTIPANATLMGSIAMTALLGRVPVDGTVNDPYPFKVLIGRTNLTANGIDLPQVAGAVVTGSASGDWTLSCVRGQIRSITFVFEDGTIRTLPEQGDGSGNTETTQGGLGWISDPHGIPCIAGKRRSNAQEYLGSQALITAAGAATATLIQSQSSGTAYIANGTGGIGQVGIPASEAMGRVLGNGVQEMSQWVNKLYGQAFAAIYVEPGAQVAVHIEQPLTIDYDDSGRKVDHSLGERHVPDLD
ncbi:TIGR03752 family integrating conjugative element protein [Pseudomonas huaxiensis]|uniref:TIGR03752 family integrating conjugative element protein n=1 Tax=Pseudomonas huaxiensis TaxID=2213017 RepID=UPI000DA64D1A|nr:TIGR03752 family integrating conjugative element protein [Pseudomonas huaxiensis]